MLLKPIYDLTRKGRPFIWTKVYQEAFENIKARLLKSLVLHLPDNKGRLQLFSDTIKTAAGPVLYEIQNGTPKLIGYASKRLSPEAVNYSVIELELLGLCVNINQFKHLFTGVDFDCTVDNLALTYIMKSKPEAASAGIKRLLEIISAYSFNLYYMKGKTGH